MEERVCDGLSTPMGMSEEAVAIAEDRRVVGVRAEVSSASRLRERCIS